MDHTKACEDDFGAVVTDLGGRNRSRSCEILPVLFCTVSKCGYSSMELHKRKSNLKKEANTTSSKYLHAFLF